VRARIEMNEAMEVIGKIAAGDKSAPL